MRVLQSPHSPIHFSLALRFILLVLLSLFASVQAYAQSYTIIDLGSLGGGYSIATCINNKGQVVGNSNTSGDQVLHPFIWSNGHMTDIGAQGNFMVHGVNNNGQVVGFLDSGDSFNPVRHAILWQNGVITDIGTLGGSVSSASGINNNLQIVGGSLLSGNNVTHAYLWHNGTMTDIGDLGGSYSYADGINDNSQVAGYSNLANGTPHPFIWSNGHMTDIGDLGGRASYANGINNNGQVIGFSYLTGNSAEHAFIWQNGIMIDMGTLGGDYSYAASINNNGQVVGHSTFAGNNVDHTFLWQNGTMTDLTTLIPLNSGWEILEANSINDAGQIVGYGSIQGQYHAFLMTPDAITNITAITTSPNPVTGSNTAEGNVTLSSAAVADTLITLASNSPTAMVPASVTVLSGNTSAAFPITTSPVLSDTTVTLSATLNSITKQASLTVTPSKLVSLTTSPNSVVGSKPATGKVTLSGFAPVGGYEILLTSSDTSTASVPVSVTVPDGLKTVTFPISTTPVAASTSVTVSVAFGRFTKAATLTVTPVQLVALTTSPSTVVGSKSAKGKIILNGFAPVGGYEVNLSSSDTSIASVPVSVIVPAGSNTATFPISTTPVEVSSSVSISGSYAGITKDTSLTVTPIQMFSLTTSPSSVVGGKLATGKVTLSGFAPIGGYEVSLSSSDTSTASVPVSVTVPAGFNTATFPISTTPVAASSTISISASFGGVSKAASVTVIPASLLSFSLKSTSVFGGTNDTATVKLNGNAPVGGTVIILNSSDSAAVLPANVTIEAGATSATFTIITIPVSSDLTIGLHAIYNGVDKTANITVKAPVITSLVLKPNSVKGGVSSVATITLSSLAPTGGLPVSLSSSDTSSAIVPGSINVAAGQKTATFTVTSQTVSILMKPVISAVTGIITKSATLSVKP